MEKIIIEYSYLETDDGNVEISEVPFTLIYEFVLHFKICNGFLEFE